MPRKSVLTPRMEAEIQLAELGRKYQAACEKLDEYRRGRVKAAELVSHAERNLASFAKSCDEAYIEKRSLREQLTKAEDEYGRLEGEFVSSIEAKLLTESSDDDDLSNM